MVPHFSGFVHICEYCLNSHIYLTTKKAKEKYGGIFEIQKSGDNFRKDRSRHYIAPFI